MNIHKLEKICIELNPGPPHDNDTTKQWRNAWAVETQKLRTRQYENHTTKEKETQYLQEIHSMLNSICLYRYLLVRCKSAGGEFGQKSIWSLLFNSIGSNLRRTCQANAEVLPLSNSQKEKLYQHTKSYLASAGSINPFVRHMQKAKKSSTSRENWLSEDEPPNQRKRGEPAHARGTVKCFNCNRRFRDNSGLFEHKKRCRGNGNFSSRLDGGRSDGRQAARRSGDSRERVRPRPTSTTTKRRY
jgi:hypothetical protein